MTKKKQTTRERMNSGFRLPKKERVAADSCGAGVWCTEIEAELSLDPRDEDKFLKRLWEGR